MSDHAIVLVGGPDSGKTNYLARLWEALRSREGALVAPDVPGDISYVEEALGHLLQGKFAPRSDKNFEESTKSFSVPVIPAREPDALPIQVVVPDVTGELWKDAVETCELPSQWMENLRAAFGALLFVRIGSNQIIEPLDWVTAADLLRMPTMQAANRDDTREIPTQVLLCELLRFLEHGLAAELDGVKPRVAILVTAWDRLDAQRAAQGPMRYLAAEFPLLAGRLADISELSVQVFGVSVVGGDFVDEAFMQHFFDKELKDSGYVVQEVHGEIQTKPDVTLPVAWLLEGLDDV